MPRIIYIYYYSSENVLVGVTGTDMWVYSCTNYVIQTTEGTNGELGQWLQLIGLNFFYISSKLF